MQGVLRLIKITLIGGVIFLVPLVLIFATLDKAFRIIKIAAKPIGKLLPANDVAGFALVDVVTIVLMLALCITAGIISRSRFGQRITTKFDAILLRLVPGYGWIKGVTGNLSDDEAKRRLKPVLARLDDQVQLGYEVDRTDDGLVAIYLPGAPDPRAGTLTFMTPDRVEPVDASFQTVLMSFKRLGCESANMLRTDQQA